MKICRVCQSEKNLKSFYKKKSNKDGRENICKDCSKQWHKEYYQDNLEVERKKRKERSRWYRENKPDKVRSWKLQQRYNITLEERDSLLKQQDYSCAICGLELTEKQICVDHNHDTGEVREILCQNCNKGIGCFLDDPEITAKATKYLEKWVV